MKIPAVRKLVENESLEALRKAEEQLLEEQAIDIEVEGDDEGEQLTHVFAAIFILEEMQNNGADFKTALRTYTKKVRSSIS